MLEPIESLMGGVSPLPMKITGHAGAIISGGKGNASDKIEMMKSADITISESPADIGKTLLNKLSN